MFENAGMAAELLGPHHVAQFVLPHHRRLVEHTRRAGSHLAIIEHNCASRPYFDEIQATDVDAMSFATADLPGAVDPASRDRGLVSVGMVDHAELMLNGEPNDVHAAAVRCIDAAGDRPFVLSTGCEIPFKAPAQNIASLVRAAQDRSGN